MTYRYEPNDLWAAVTSAADFLGPYARGERHCFLSGAAATATARIRFRRLMSPRAGTILVDKSPANALRIGFLEAIAPGALFVHIIRDGVQVAHSIAHMAGVTRPMAFRPPLNDWWGVRDAKWTAMAQDAGRAGYYGTEISQLAAHEERGAFEWLLSMREMESWRSGLGSRLIELRLDDLIDSPRDTLRAVFDGLGAILPVTDAWLDQVIRQVRPGSSSYPNEVCLPPLMRADFNRIQRDYGFKGQAVPRYPAAANLRGPNGPVQCLLPCAPGP